MQRPDIFLRYAASFFKLQYHNNYNPVSITEDLTTEERQKDKELYDKMKEQNAKEKGNKCWKLSENAMIASTWRKSPTLMNKILTSIIYSSDLYSYHFLNYSFFVCFFLFKGGFPLISFSYWKYLLVFRIFYIQKISSIATTTTTTIQNVNRILILIETFKKSLFFRIIIARSY